MTIARSAVRGIEVVAIVVIAWICVAAYRADGDPGRTVVEALNVLRGY